MAETIDPRNHTNEHENSVSDISWYFGELVFDFRGYLSDKQVKKVKLMLNNFNGGTGEDRFYGVFSSAGIASIRIMSSGNSGIEVDHVQYGSATPSQVVPEPTTMFLLVTGLAGIGVSINKKEKESAEERLSRSKKTKQTKRPSKLFTDGFFVWVSEVSLAYVNLLNCEHNTHCVRAAVH